MSNYTTDQIINAVDQLRLRKKFPKGFTTTEFSESIGTGIVSGRGKLKQLIAAGMAELNGQKPMMRMDGKYNLTPVYRLKISP